MISDAYTRIARNYFNPDPHGSNSSNRGMQRYFVETSKDLSHCAELWWENYPEFSINHNTDG
jgi:hypothetical protein